MGLFGSKRVNVLVIGLTNAGKTHFLDLFHLGPDTTKMPTNGFYQTVYYFENYEFVLTEYGGTTSWVHLPDAQCIFAVVRDNVMEANSALLMVAKRYPDVPVAVLWNGTPPTTGFFYPRNRPTCAVTFNFEDDTDRLEKTYRLFQWVCKNLK
jgi:hypothetical protein